MQLDSFDETFSLTDNNNINIFYHLFTINDYSDRFNRTYKKITDSGLIQNINLIHLNVVGPNQLEAKDLFKTYDKVKCYHGTNHKNESETLNLMRQFCIDNPYGYSLYLHSKGVNRQNDPEITVKEGLQDWIDCMEYFLIEKYENCLNILKYKVNNTCGIGYIDANSCGVNLGGYHYSGNFWWVNNKYLATTKPCKDEYMYCELEFLFSGEQHKPFEVHKPRIQYPQWFHERYKREEYEVH